MAETLTELENQLEEARDDLHYTLGQVNQKVAVATERLAPDRLVRRNPGWSLSAAILAGFALGSENRAALGALAVGAALSFGFHRNFRSDFPSKRSWRGQEMYAS